MKRNRFITLTGAQKSVNRDLEAKAKALAGWKGYITNLADPRPEYVIGAYHQLWQIEKSFRIVPRQVVGRVSSCLEVGMVALARPRWTSRGRFQAMVS